MALAGPEDAQNEFGKALEGKILSSEAREAFTEAMIKNTVSREPRPQSQLLSLPDKLKSTTSAKEYVEIVNSLPKYGPDRVDDKLTKGIYALLDSRGLRNYQEKERILQENAQHFFDLQPSRAEIESLQKRVDIWDKFVDMGVPFKKLEQSSQLVGVASDELFLKGYDVDPVALDHFLNRFASHNSKPKIEDFVEIVDKLRNQELKKKVGLVGALFGEVSTDLKDNKKIGDLASININRSNKKVTTKSEIQKVLKNHQSSWKGHEDFLKKWVYRATIKNQSTAQLEEFARYTISQQGNPQNLKIIYENFSNELAKIIDPELELKLIIGTQYLSSSDSSTGNKYLKTKRMHPEVKNIIRRKMQARQSREAYAMLFAVGLNNTKFAKEIQMLELEHMIKDKDFEGIKVFTQHKDDGPLVTNRLKQWMEDLRKEKGIFVQSKNKGHIEKIRKLLNLARNKHISRRSKKMPEKIALLRNGDYSDEDLKKVFEHYEQRNRFRSDAKSDFYRLAETLYESNKSPEFRKEIIQYIAEHMAQAPKSRGGFGYSPEDTKIFVDTVMNQDDPLGYLQKTRRHFFHKKASNLTQRLRSVGKPDPRGPVKFPTRKAMQRKASCFHSSLSNIMMEEATYGD